MKLKKLRDKLKAYLLDVLRIKTSPHSIALGFSIGTFIGILPTPGFGVLIGLLVILIDRRISKLALFGALAFWNPLTLTPLYFLSYRIGDALFGTSHVTRYRIVLLNQVYNFTRRYLVGNLILAILFSISTYFLVRMIAQNYQNSKKGAQ